MQVQITDTFQRTCNALRLKSLTRQHKSYTFQMTQTISNQIKIFDKGAKPDYLKEKLIK